MTATSSPMSIRPAGKLSKVIPEDGSETKLMYSLMLAPTSCRMMSNCFFWSAETAETVAAAAAKITADLVFIVLCVETSVKVLVISVLRESKRQERQLLVEALLYI